MNIKNYQVLRGINKEQKNNSKHPKLIIGRIPTTQRKKTCTTLHTRYAPVADLRLKASSATDQQDPRGFFCLVDSVREAYGSGAVYTIR